MLFNFGLEVPRQLSMASFALSIAFASMRHLQGHAHDGCPLASQADGSSFKWHLIQMQADDTISSSLPVIAEPC